MYICTCICMSEDNAASCPETASLRAAGRAASGLSQGSWQGS